MKYLKHITFMFFSLLLLVACSEEDMVKGNSSESISFKLSIPSTTETRSGTSTATDKEKTIDNVYILIYEVNQGMDVTPVFFHSVIGLNMTGGWEQSFVKSLMGLEKDKEYKIYALANMPKAENGVINAPAKTMTQNNLVTLTESLPGTRKEDGSDISFTGTHRFTYTGAETNLSISLTRSVARLDIEIAKDPSIAAWTIESVSISNENNATCYFTNDVQIPVNTGLRTTSQKLLWNDSDGKYHYYAYENEVDVVDNAKKLLLTMTLKDTDNTIHTYQTVINKEGNGAIKRNYVYKVKISLKDTPIAPTEVICSVVEWVELDYSTNVGGKVSYIDNPDKIYFSVGGAGVLSIKTDADTLFVKLRKTNRLIAFKGNEEADSLGFVVNKGNNICDIDLRLTTLTVLEYSEPITISAGHISKTATCIRAAGQLAAELTESSATDENLQFPWDYGLSATGVVDDVIRFNIRRNVNLYYTVQMIVYEKLEDVGVPNMHIYNEKMFEQQLPPVNEPNIADELTFKMSDKPFEVPIDRYDRRDTLVYLFRFDFRMFSPSTNITFIWKTFTYTILPAPMKPKSAK